MGKVATQTDVRSTQKRISGEMRFLVGRPGIEPGTISLKGCCSIQLSYRPAFPDGTSDGPDGQGTYIRIDRTSLVVRDLRAKGFTPRRRR